MHRSESSPDRQALLRKAKAKLRAARDPTLARPRVALSEGFRGSLDVFLVIFSVDFLLSSHLSLTWYLLLLSGCKT